MPRESRGRRGSDGDVEGVTGTPRESRGRRGSHGDVEGVTGTPSDFGQAFAHGQAPRPKGEGLDHERKGWGHPHAWEEVHANA